MAFSDFAFPSVLGELGVTLGPTVSLFTAVPSVAPRPVTVASLVTGTRLGQSAHTEMSRMIWMAGPVLSDFWERYNGSICLIAGAEFIADPANRLSGFCDFVICHAPQQSVVLPPIVMIFEAKRDSLPNAFGQCIAGMVGAQRFNLRNNIPVEPIYGCATTGTSWKFLRLVGSTLTIDQDEYLVSQTERILGILTHIVGPPPAVPNAA